MRSNTRIFNLEVMGNQAVKAFKESDVSVTSNSSPDESASPASLTTTAIHGVFRKTSAKLSFSDSGDFVANDDVLLSWASPSRGLFKDAVTVYYDGQSTAIAVSVSKTGFSKDSIAIYRPKPGFSGQKPVADPASVKGDPLLAEFYHWAQIETKRSISAGTSTFRLVTGGTAEEPVFSEPLYTGQKVSAMAFYAYVRNNRNDIVCKMYFGKGTFNTTMEADVAGNVDMVAAFGVGAALGGGGGNAAGALAGAGVV